MLISAGFFAFVLNVPFIVAKSLAGNSLEYGKWYRVVALGFWLGSFIASQISERIGANTMLKLGWSIATLATFSMTFSMIFSVIAYGVSYWSLFIPMTIFTFGRGISLPNAQASAVSVTPYKCSTAMGIFSFCQLLIGAALAQFSVVFVKQNVTFLPVVIFILAVLALIAYFKAIKINVG